MASAPPGWYRDPGGAAAQRWWDGSRWTGFLAPSPAAMAGYWAQSVDATTRSEARIAPWVIPAGCLYAVASATSIVLFLASVSTFVHDIRLLFQAGLSGAPAFTQPAALQVSNEVVLPLQVLAGIVLLVWQYRVATTARTLGYPSRHSPGLGVGSWFIPVVSVWFPYQAIRDCLPPGHPARTVVLRAWLGYVFTLLAGPVAIVTAFAWRPVGVVVGAVVVLGWILVATWAYRVVKAISADHSDAAQRLPAVAGWHPGQAL